HPAALDQHRRLFGVDLRPHASWPARREALKPRAIVERPLLTVDPPKAQRDVERLLIVRRREPAVLLRDLHPDAGRLRVIGFEPLLPRGRGLEQLHREIRLEGRSRRSLHTAPTCFRMTAKSLTGRISTQPVRVQGKVAPIRTASSMSSASMRLKPAMTSFVSANGPSRMVCFPLRTRTDFAVVVGPRICESSRRPCLRRSSACSMQPRIVSLNSRGLSSSTRDSSL